jgi:hypothetical protein
MKTPDSMEEIMRSWTPRAPSRQIEQQLFRTERREAKVEGRRRTVSLPWYQTLGASLVGSTVVLLTILNFTHLAAVQQISTPFSPMSNHLSSLAMAGSAPVNMWTAPILGWTNEGSVGTTHRSFELLNTNRLLY